MSNLIIKYNHSDHFIKIYSESFVNTTDFIQVIDELSKYTAGTRNLNVLIDLTDVDIDMSPKDLGSISHRLCLKVPVDFSLRIAKIVNGQIETALAMLFMDEIKWISHIEFKIFNTKTAALEWLNIKYEK